MNYLENYARMVIQSGINIQPGQTLVIKAPIQVPEFVRLCSKEAYISGAKQVVIRWFDEVSNRIDYDMAADETFDETDQWLVDFNNHYANIDAALLSISASDPEIMKGVDPSKISRKSKAYAQKLKDYYNMMTSNKFVWCMVCLPSKAWAKKVFPNYPEQEAEEALWKAILKVTRADLEDPVTAWRDHQVQLDQKLDILNNTNFRAFKYKNSIGTDVIVEMPENHLWFGGADTHTLKGYKFIANIPTEEVYSLPKRNGVNGRIVSSYPLNYHGVLIENFWFEFKDGEVVDYDAKVNKEMLTEMLNTDEGAKRLGEIALVPYDSPISNTGLLFYNTLFDENASCHFALGEAYPICIKDGENMTETQLIESNANISDIHVDFMVGTKDLEIIGITAEGVEVQIFLNGNFVI